jgi:SAM-dependent methyltransferase
VEDSARRRRYLFYERWRRRIAPGVSNPQDDYEQLLFGAVEATTRWLDLGCGHELLPSWRPDQEKVLLARPALFVGVDAEMASLKANRFASNKVGGNIGRLPFADRAFDLVTANMVVEHLDDPEMQFKEVRRVLRDGGRFAFHTPNGDGYFVRLRRLVSGRLAKALAGVLEGRPSEDVFPVHYRANTTSELRRLATDCGFEIERLDLVRSDAILFMMPPLFFPELLLLRALGNDRWARFRPNLIAVLRASAS